MISIIGFLKKGYQMGFDIGSMCGSTPLIRVSEKLYAKLETFSPTGSVKDRMISYVVEKAIKAATTGVPQSVGPQP
jgi:cysteine synthase